MSSSAVLGAEFVQFAFGETFAGDVAWDAHQLGDGRVLLSGFERTSLSEEGQTQAVFARLNADFSIDTTFGNGGFVKPAGDERFARVVVDSDGSFFAYRKQWGSIGPDAIQIRRYTADGVLDASFGTAGVSVVGFARHSIYATSAWIDPEGRLLLSAKSQERVQRQSIGEPTRALVRVNVDGSVDQSFGDSGLLLLDSNFSVREGAAYSFVGGDVVFRNDGGFYFGGEILSTGGDGSLITTSVFSFTEAGIVDQSFGNGGEVVLFSGERSSSVSNLELTANGDLVAVVSSIQPIFSPQTGGQTFPLLTVYKISAGVLDSGFAQGAVIDDETFPAYPDLAPGQTQSQYWNAFVPGAAAFSVDADGSIRVAYQEQPRVAPVNSGLEDPALIRVMHFSVNGEFIGQAERAVAVPDHLLAVARHFFTTTGDLVSIGTIYSGGYFDSKLSPEESFARSGTGDIFITRLITADEIAAPAPEAPIADAPATSAPIDRANELKHESHQPSLISLLSSDDEVDEFGELLAA